MPSLQTDASSLFGRSYQLTITPPNSEQAHVYGNIGSKCAPLRVKFSVERDLTAHANKATIGLTNLSLSSRQRIVKGATFALNAGYRSNAGLIFYGTADKIESKREGADIETTIECKDAANVLQYATVDLSYKGPVRLSAVLRDIVNAMQVSVGGIANRVQPGIAVSLPRKTFSRLHLTGTCADNLKQILANTDIEWSVQNGRIIFAPKKEPITQVAVLLSESSGLVNIPSANSDFVTLSSLMTPRLFPGAYVVLQSINKQLSGSYKLRKTKHQGDSHGGDWAVEAEAIPLDERGNALPTRAPVSMTSTTAYEGAEE